MGVSARQCEVHLGCSEPAIRQVQTLMSVDLFLIGVERLEWAWACEKHAPLYELPTQVAGPLGESA
jgi:hypothetical protein